jgi:hypothetical protein
VSRVQRYQDLDPETGRPGGFMDPDPNGEWVKVGDLLGSMKKAAEEADQPGGILAHWTQGEAEKARRAVERVLRTSSEHGNEKQRLNAANPKTENDEDSA